MAQSYKNRYCGKEDEIKEAIRTFGSLKAGEIYGAKDMVAWDNHAKNVMGNEKYQLVVEALLRTDEELRRELALEIIKLASEMYLENKRLKEENFNLQQENEIKTQNKKIELVKIMETMRNCEV